MAFKYIWNLKHQEWLEDLTHRFPKTPHPHADFFSSDLKLKIRDVMGKVIPSSDFLDVIEGRKSAQSYLEDEDKIGIIEVLGIEQEHLTLVDGLLNEFRKDIPNFVRIDLYQSWDSSETAHALMQNAYQACFRYHMLTPFV